MGDELTSLLAIFKKVEESGGKATLSVTTKSGVTKTKLELVSPPSTPATATTSSSAAPAPGGQRRRRRGPAARMKVNARAAQHRATLAELTTPPAKEEILLVLHWVLLFHLTAAFTFIPHQSLTLDNARSYLLKGGRFRPTPSSTWMAPLCPLLLHWDLPLLLPMPLPTQPQPLPLSPLGRLPYPSTPLPMHLTMLTPKLLPDGVLVASVVLEPAFLPSATTSRHQNVME